MNDDLNNSLMLYLTYFRETLSEDMMSRLIEQTLTEEERSYYYSWASQHRDGIGEERIRPDFFLKYGWSNQRINGRTIIEVRKQLSLNVIERYLRMRSSLKGEVENFVVVYYQSEICQSDLNRIAYEGLRFLDIGDLFRFESSKASHTHKKSPRKQADEKLLRKMQEFGVCKYTHISQEESITEAKKAFGRGNVVLFLGAGVSMSAQLPSWDSLLKEILFKMTDVGRDGFERIQDKCFNSSIISARYIKNMIWSNCQNNKKKISRNAFERRFCKMVGDTLYKNREPKLSPTKGESELIMSIGNLIDHGRETVYLSTNNVTINTPNVESVITYNYDDLVECELQRRGISYSTVAKGDKPLAGDLPILHVHGILYSGRMKRFNTRIVLSEEEYHASYKEAYNWTTIEQLHAMRYQTCFFIGLSMSDPNLRRLLDFASDVSNRNFPHYAFLQNERLGDEAFERESAILEGIMKSFGINVVWFSSFDELPVILNKIAE